MWNHAPFLVVLLLALASESHASSRRQLSKGSALLERLNALDLKAHDPSRLVEVSPGIYAFATTTDSNDRRQRSALKLYALDTTRDPETWRTWETWPFGTAIDGVEQWHLPWMEAYGYEVDGFDDFHQELALVAPSFYRKDVLYFSLWNEPGANRAAEAGNEGAMYRAIYRATASGEWPRQEWTMEPTPVYYSDTGAFDAQMPRGIDAHVWDGPDGAMHLTFGSWDPEGAPVIVIADMDEATGRIEGAPPGKAGSHATVRRALHPVATFGEAAYSFYRRGWYYLFINLGSCCSGVNSTYEIVVGRSRSVRGPYVDHEGRSFMDRYNPDLANFPGKRVLGSEGRFIGPGHTGLLEVGGKLFLSFHYYDGQRDGESRFGVRLLSFDRAGWPVIVRE